MHRPQTNRRQRGISLLEVLAALVILSLGASVAFTWLGQSVRAMGRLKDEEATLLARTEALDYLRAVNPLAQPSGDVQLPEYQLRWSSRQIRDTRPTLSSLGTRSRYDVALFELNVELTRPGQQEPWTTFVVQRSGFVQVGTGSMSIFGGGRAPE